LFNDDLLATTLSKLLKLAQGNATKLNAVLDNQEKFQEMLDAQQNQISAIMAKITL
jgi:ABC-type transporter Mla subunit MlaD